MSERLRQFEALLDAYVWAHNDLQNYPFNDVNRSEYELAAIEARAAVLLAFQTEEERKAVELLRLIRKGHMIQPSMLARNWEAYELLREVDALLGELSPQRD